MGITNRNGRWTAQIRYKDIKITQTFQNKTSASKWVRDVKSSIDARRWPEKSLILPRDWGKWGLLDAAPEPVNDAVPHAGWTLHRALDLYHRTVTETKKSWESEGNRIRWWQRRPLTHKSLAEVSAVDINTHIAERARHGRKQNTIRNEVLLLSAVFEHAAKPVTKGGWGLDLTNPVREAALPPPPKARSRRLEHLADGRDEEAMLVEAIQDGPNGDQMLSIMILAIETGMRQGELLDVRIGQVKQTHEGRYIAREDSKNGERRKVVLSSRAASVIDRWLLLVRRDAPEARLFDLNHDQVGYRWKLALKAAGIEGLRWHDLRHEALSRMAHKGLTLGELQSQSGHKTVQVLAGYLTAKVSEVTAKLG